MTSPHRRADTQRYAAASKPPTRPRQNILYGFLLFALIYAVLFILHLPLLTLPYYWDEAGYFVPAARDLLLTGDPVPHSTLSNAHPPLVMVYLALCWKIFGMSIFATRTAMLGVAALALTGVFYLARRVANRAVAFGTIICTALYPVFFAQSTLAHLDMTVAALTFWALWFYLPPQQTESPGESNGVVEAEAFDDALFDASHARRFAALFLLALAALTKETAILIPVTLMSWELLCWFIGRRRATPLAFCFAPRRRQLKWSMLWLLALVPLALWFAYHRQRTGYVFGNPEYVRYNIASTVNPSRILYAGIGRLWHVAGYMNLFVLTGATLVAMFRPPLRDAGHERRRINIRTQAVFGVLIAAHVVALSVVGGAVLARYMLPVLPLLILVCVSTIWRRVRRWRLALALVCAAFVVGLFVNPPVRFPFEDNLAYRDFILLHKGAGKFLSANYADAGVLTAWPATDELKNPYYGYTDKPLRIAAAVEHFSTEQISAALRDQPSFDVAYIFSTNYADDLLPDDAARLLGGRIVYRGNRRGQWVAVVEVEKRAGDER